jgi:hypothetical protein
MITFSPWYIGFTLGTIIVAAMASMRFNFPLWHRTYTTSFRYHLALALFLIFQIAVYYVLCSIARHYALDLSGIGARDTSAVMLGAPILIALVVGLLLPLVPQYERWLRDKLLSVGGIPGEGEQLARLLEGAPFLPGEGVLAEAKSLMVRRGVDLDRQWLAPAEPLKQLLVKAAVVYLHLHSWESKPRYAHFFAEARINFDNVRQRFDQLSLQVSRTFTNIERIGEVSYLLSSSHAEPVSGEATTSSAAAGHKPSAGTTAAEGEEIIKKIVADLLCDLHEEVATVFKDFCRFTARAVLTCEFTERMRTQRLVELGFQLEGRGVARSFNALLYAGAVVLFSVWLFFAVFATGADQPMEVPIPILVVMITAIQVGALTVAIVPKVLWRFANSGISGRTPIGFVVGAGLAGVVVSGCLNLLVGFLVLKGWDGAWQRLQHAYPWVLSAFSTAATTAYLVQDQRWEGTSSIERQRMLDALVLGVVMCLASLAVQFWFFKFSPDQRDHTRDFDDPIRVMVSLIFSFVLGGLIGYIVPGSFRERRDTTALLRTLDRTASAPPKARSKIPVAVEHHG